MSDRTRTSARRLYAAFGVAVIALGVYFVGALNDWAWYEMAGPYLTMIAVTMDLMFGPRRWIRVSHMGDPHEAWYAEEQVRPAAPRRCVVCCQRYGDDPGDLHVYPDGCTAHSQCRDTEEGVATAHWHNVAKPANEWTVSQMRSVPVDASGFDHQRCSDCGEAYPAPVELHHTDQECLDNHPLEPSA